MIDSHLWCQITCYKCRPPPNSLARQPPWLQVPTQKAISHFFCPQRRQGSNTPRRSSENQAQQLQLKVEELDRWMGQSFEGRATHCTFMNIAFPFALCGLIVIMRETQSDSGFYLWRIWSLHDKCFSAVKIMDLWYLMYKFAFKVWVRCCVQACVDQIINQGCWCRYQNLLGFQQNYTPKFIHFVLLLCVCVCAPILHHGGLSNHTFPTTPSSSA